MEERMNTLKAENTSAQERLNATLERFRTDMANSKIDAERRDKEAKKRDKEATHRETANTRWIMASILATAGLIVILLH